MSETNKRQEKRLNRINKYDFNEDDFEMIDVMYKQYRKYNCDNILLDRKNERRRTRLNNGNKYELYDTTELLKTLDNTNNEANLINKIMAGKMRLANIKK